MVGVASLKGGVQPAESEGLWVTLGYIGLVLDILVWSPGESQAGHLIQSSALTL